MAENNTSSVVENLRKRKQSIDANLSHSEDNIVKKRWISLTDPVEIIDKEGDLYLGLDGGTLKVSRKALSLSSPVFLAMLGAHSRFAESNQQSFHADGVQFISFSDDDFESMEIVARIIHLQFDQVPDSLLFSQLYHIAVLCDKYDLKRCLGMYPDLWSKPYLNSYRLEGYEGWLSMSIVFRYDGLFKEVTRHLRLNAQVTGGGALVLNQNYDLGNGISSTIIGSSSFN